VFLVRLLANWLEFVRRISRCDLGRATAASHRQNSEKAKVLLRKTGLLSCIDSGSLTEDVNERRVSSGLKTDFGFAQKQPVESTVQRAAPERPASRNPMGAWTDREFRYRALRV
jgi:hypothetical protein